MPHFFTHVTVIWQIFEALLSYQHLKRSTTTHLAKQQQALLELIMPRHLSCWGALSAISQSRCKNSKYGVQDNLNRSSIHNCPHLPRGRCESLDFYAFNHGCPVRMIRHWQWITGCKEHIQCVMFSEAIVGTNKRMELLCSAVYSQWYWTATLACQDVCSTRRSSIIWAWTRNPTEPVRDAKDLKTFAPICDRFPRITTYFGNEHRQHVPKFVLKKNMSSESEDWYQKATSGRSKIAAPHSAGLQFVVSIEAHI